MGCGESRIYACRIGSLALFLLLAGISADLSRAHAWINGQLDDNPLEMADRPAVWTGHEAIIFNAKGGGQRYDPVTRKWKRLPDRPNRGLPDIALRIGNEVFLWQDSGNLFERFDPATDSYSELSSVGAPPVMNSVLRACFDGTEVFLYGANVASQRPAYLYDVATDSWRQTSPAGAPVASVDHVVVCAGDSYVVWDGSGGTPSGAIYDPGTDSWSALPTEGQPSGFRNGPVAAWDGQRVLIWGGDAFNTEYKDGARYDPVGKRWTPMADAPFRGAYGVWTGESIFYWNQQGAIYRPESNRWFFISNVGDPNQLNSDFQILWLGQKAMVWGGLLPPGLGFKSGALYDAVTDSWEPTAEENGIPTGTSRTVWTGDRVLFGTEALYDPVFDRFEPVSQVAAPVPGPAVWTGSEAIVYSGSQAAPGARYSPAADQWTALSSVNAPSDRTGAATAWNGGQMLVVGGSEAAATHTAKLYIAGNDSWIGIADVPSALLPNGFRDPQAFWTGSEFIVWDRAARRGLTYTVATNSWDAIPQPQGFNPQVDSDALWYDGSLIVFGSLHAYLYSPSTEQWTEASTPQLAEASAGSLSPLSLSSDGEYLFASDTGNLRYDRVLDLWESRSAVNQIATPNNVWTGTLFVHVGASRSGRYFPDDDGDGDGLGLDDDNCPAVANLDQADSDGDGQGDACDRCPNDSENDADYDGLCADVDPCPRAAADDSDGDGVCDDVDPCPILAEAIQIDSDGDGYGDACDPFPMDRLNDVDRDGVSADVDNCPYKSNDTQLDSDFDGVGTSCDNCVLTVNSGQEDADLDEVGNACDNCVDSFNPNQEDSDADSYGDACDLCPGIAGTAIRDVDQDGFGDTCDVCPFDTDALQIDSDSDGAGDACDCAPFDGGSRVAFEATMAFGNRTGAATAHFHWSAAEGAAAYGVTRGLIADLGPSEFGGCLTTALVSTSFEDTDVPGPGSGYTYLFLGVADGCGAGTLGLSAGLVERENLNPAACP